jgi:predicted phosphodiesterase
VGGDVVPGPMPRECLRRLLALDVPVQFVHGNCELSALAQMEAARTGVVKYWGTTSGRPLPEVDQVIMRWTAEQIQPEFEDLIATWPRTLRLSVDGVGDVLFCHGTPRSETEIILRTTAEENLRPLFDPLGADLVICGHTHMQFDRRVGGTRVVNAGSVGAPFGRSGAYWSLIGPGVELRRTEYDLERAAERIRATDHPRARESAEEILNPRPEEEMLALFQPAEVALATSPRSGAD